MAVPADTQDCADVWSEGAVPASYLATVRSTEGDGIAWMSRRWDWRVTRHFESSHLPPPSNQAAVLSLANTLSISATTQASRLPGITWATQHARNPLLELRMRHAYPKPVLFVLTWACCVSHQSFQVFHRNVVSDGRRGGF